ncbi:hypothetical protein ACH5WX_11315, partial [Nocardioides sp. CER28]
QDEPPAAAEPEATVAGLPVFDDTEAPGAQDPADTPYDAWFAPREDAPEPPPPLEPPPERPLFAPEPSDGAPARRARPSTPSTASTSERAADSAAYWPFDAEPEQPPVPGRRWLRLGLLLGALLLLVIGGIVAWQVRDGGDHAADTPTTSPRATPTSTPAARPISGTTANDFDPLGSPPAENSDLAPRAVDGDPSTSWRTSTYRQNLGPGGIKSGVGLIVDLKTAHHVSRVDLTFAQPGVGVSIYVGASAPTSADDLGTPAARATAAERTQVPIDPAATGRFVTVWLTSLPQVAGGFRAELSEVSVIGTRA